MTDDKSMVASKIHHDPDFLRVAYHVRGQTMAEIANVCGVSEGAIENQMNRHGVPRRKSAIQLERFSNTKLKESEVVEIRERYRGGEQPHSIAVDFGIRPGSIWHIVNGKSWHGAGGPVKGRDY